MKQKLNPLQSYSEVFAGGSTDEDRELAVELLVTVWSYGAMVSGGPVDLLPF